MVREYDVQFVALPEAGLDKNGGTAAPEVPLLEHGDAIRQIFLIMKEECYRL